jgi:hypothetical protein
VDSTLCQAKSPGEEWNWTIASISPSEFSMEISSELIFVLSIVFVCSITPIEPGMLITSIINRKGTTLTVSPLM